jgi:hypothetical protein
MPRKMQDRCKKNHDLTLPDAICYKACCAACNREVKAEWELKKKQQRDASRS